MTRDIPHNAKRFGLTEDDLKDERILRLVQRKIALDVKVDAIKAAGGATRGQLFIKLAATYELSREDLSRRPVKDLLEAVVNSLVYLARITGPTKVHPTTEKPFSPVKPGNQKERI
jgi:hypothetical protein